MLTGGGDGVVSLEGTEGEVQEKRSCSLRSEGDGDDGRGIWVGETGHGSGKLKNTGKSFFLKKAEIVVRKVDEMRDAAGLIRTQGNDPLCRLSRRFGTLS